MDNKNKLDLLILLAKSFSKEFPIEVYEKWVELLSDVLVENLEAGINWLMRNSRFMPTLADIIEASENNRVRSSIVADAAPRIEMTDEEIHKFLEEADAYADDKI